MENNELLKQAELIFKGRARHNKFDTQELRNKRNTFLENCSARWANDGKVNVCAMYDVDGEVVSSRYQIHQYLNRYWNTMKMLPSFIIIELETENQKVLLDAALATFRKLAKEKIHFALLRADKSKSYYFMIFNFMQLYDFDKMQRAKAREMFIRNIVPFEYYHYVDKAFFNEVKMPIPFAPHWRHGEIFDLIIEYKPKEVIWNNKI